jgi:glutamate-ammonia-ligase adenylyltransferase
MSVGPRLSILGLGRLGSGGVDYGSDLDVILIYDSLVASPVAGLTAEEAYARLGELMIAALSSVTREGYLYRVDVRLRPDGKGGPLVSASQSFLDYLSQRADVWEWLAYVKARAVAGDLELGRMIETHARHAIHEAAQKIASQTLKDEARRVRDRLEKEKSRSGRNRGGIDIKYGAGGMLDVYFAVRYLQLRDDVRDQGEDRSTAATVERLREAGSFSEEDYLALSDGYSLLRSVDHNLRLIAGRSARLPTADHPVMRDIAKQLGFSSAAALTEALISHMTATRAAYDRITT